MLDLRLFSLAEILAQWVDPVPGIPSIYLFGSRVRGDHRPDSDVDVRMFLDQWEPIGATLQWWQEQNETDFATLKAQLPGPLKIHREIKDGVDDKIRSGKLILAVRKVRCVWTPPKIKSAIKA